MHIDWIGELASSDANNDVSVELQIRFKSLCPSFHILMLKYVYRPRHIINTVALSALTLHYYLAS